MQDWAYTRQNQMFTVYALCSALERLRVDPLAMCAMGLHLAASDHEDHPEKAESSFEGFLKLVRVRRGKQSGWERFCEQLGIDAAAIADLLLDHVNFAEDLLSLCTK